MEPWIINASKQEILAARCSDNSAEIDPRGLLPLPFEASQSYHAYLTMTTAEIRRETDKLVRCYREQILAGKTRRIGLLGRKCEPKIMYTFLGFEVKLGRKRLTCPDMTTARYIRVFGKLGAGSIAIPYDPSQTARALPLLEASMKKIDDLLKSEGTHVRRQRLDQSIYRSIRQKLKEAEITSLGSD